MPNQTILFQQLFEKTSSTYTYILADAKTREGIIIDPVIETVERDYALIQEMGITLRYILDTHIHADHVTGSGTLAKYTGALIAMSAQSGAAIDLPLHDGQVLECGAMMIKVLATPGHTIESMCYLVGDCVFTGDTLLIRGNGRTDFQKGSSETLYDSVMNKLYALPEDTLVYSGHDYAGFTSSTIGLEKKYNKRITAQTTKEQFVHTMSQLKLDLPKKIDVAVPANLTCGRIML
jgi:glyoxylase-like metal-dependent hydrolase (beta-lactamase superfamily II)